MKKTYKFLLCILTLLCAFALFGGCKGKGGDEIDSQETKEYFLLSDTNLALIVGDEYTLTASYDVQEDTGITYSSSNPDVAQVSENGKIEALAKGEAVITARLGDFSATCSVNVSFGDYVPTLSLPFVYGKEVTLAYTESIDFAAKVLFNGKEFSYEPSYTFSDESVGAVENGVFVPTKVGRTDVTVSGEWNGFQLLPVTVSVEILNAVEIELKDKAADNSVSSVHLYTYDVFEGNTYQVSFDAEISVVKNGQNQSDGVSISFINNNGIVEYDEATGVLRALMPGTTELCVSYIDETEKCYEKTFEIVVHKPLGVYQKTLNVDVSKGELPANEIFAAFPENAREIVAVDGEFTLSEGKVFGFTVDNEKTQEITVYNQYVGYTLTVVPYTRIFTTAEELSMFYMDDYETTYKGYYILGNDIDASSYVHQDHIRYAGNGYKMYPNIGLLGTFDGKGHTIDGITIGRSGLFAMVGNGAVIKDVGFTNVKFSGLNEGNYVLACYIVSATIKNVYIQAKELSTTGWNNALVANNITIDCVVENCIFQLDQAYTKNASFGSFTAISTEKENFASANVAFLRNCYVISPTPMTQDNRNYVCDVNGAAYVYPNVKRYESVSAMQADETNDYKSFDAAYWDLSSGIPVWKK